MTWYEKLEVQCDLLKRNGNSTRSLLEYLGDRDPSLMQLSGFSKACETSYGFLEEAIRLFASLDGKVFEGDSSHKALIDWALGKSINGSSLLPEDVLYHNWRTLRHKLRKQSLDLIVWEMIRDFVKELASTSDRVADHLLKVGLKAELAEEAAGEAK